MAWGYADSIYTKNNFILINNNRSMESSQNLDLET